MKQNLFIFILILIPGFANSQVIETIYVYDTIFIYDTIHEVYDATLKYGEISPIEAVLVKDTGFFVVKPATIYENEINMSETKEKDLFSEKIGITMTDTLKSTLERSRQKTIPTEEHTHIISWGARLPKIITELQLNFLRRLKYFNNVFDIEDHVSKINFYNKYKELINMPRLWTKDHEYHEGWSSPIILARKDYGMGGKGIKICLQQKDIKNVWDTADYFTEFIPTFREFRVHCFNNRMIRIQEKRINEEQKLKSLWIKSKRNGYKFFHLKEEEIKTKLKQFVKNFRRNIPLNFFGADIILGDNNEFYLLEINTGMGLGPTGLRIYEKNLKSVLIDWRNR